MLRRRAAAVAAAVIALIGPVAVPSASASDSDDCRDDVICWGDSTPDVPTNSSGNGGSGSASSSTPQCSWTVGSDTMVIPCSRPGAGFFYSGCYYTPAQLAPDDPAWALNNRSPSDTSGGMYRATYCLPGEEGVMGSPVWLPIPPVATMTPEELARRALSKVRLSPPPMHLTPGSGKTGLVSLPVWLWIDANQNTWGPIQNTDTDGPLSVTITATVTKIVWNMGDGGSVTCTKPGVPYNPAYNDQPSPECGYAYEHTSKGQPNDAFTVTATTYWDVTWVSTTGRNGTIPGTTRSATVGDIRVGELQVVNG